MPRPGVTVEIVEDTSPGVAPLDTGQAYMIGTTERGPVGATRVRSLLDFKNKFGAGPSLLKDSVMGFFMEGGSSLYVSPIKGDNAEAATATVGGAQATATSPGEWANGLTISTGAVSGGPAVVVQVKDGNTVLEQSTQLNSDAQAQAWQGTYVRLNKLPTAPANADLAGGVDDNTVSQATATSALDYFGYQLGPGQVLAPGIFDPNVHFALIDHSGSHHRVALLDPPNTGDPAALKAAVDEVQPILESRYSAMFAPWVIYPGETAPSTTIVPYTPLQAGIIARVDRGGNPSVSAAGDRSVHGNSLGFMYEWSDPDHETMNDQGINLGKIVYGAMQTYGYRTAAAGPETNWMFFGESRTVMAIAHEGDVAGQSYVFDTIDGRGHMYSKLAKDLIGICSRYYDMDALYGATPQDAFRVQVAEANTIDNAKAGEVIANVRVKTSKIAEWVNIPIVKVPLDRSV